MRYGKNIVLLIVSVLCLSFANAQVNDSAIAKYTVGKVIVKGNKRTKTYIITREALLKTGDTISAALLQKKLELSRENVYNTSLFNEVNVIPSFVQPGIIDINIEVKERIYILPTPLFQLVDRNFNEWIKTYKADFNRVNYGIKFIHYNLSGRKDQLKIYLLNGYTRNISFSYSAPYSNSALTEGFAVGGGFSQNREVAFTDSGRNKNIYFFPLDPDHSFIGSFVRTNAFVNASYTIRRGVYNRHSFSASYNYQKVADSVVNHYNPNYFGKKSTHVTYPDINYTYQHTNVDNVGYPLTGEAWNLSVSKRGFGLINGVNLFSVEGAYSWYKNLGKNWYAGVSLQAKIKLPFDQAYINQRALGFGGAYLRGLEYYTVDGVAYALARNTLKKKILYFKIPLPFKSKSHPYIPFTFFAKTYGDMAWSYNKVKYDTYLNKRMLFTGGFGIDVLTLYDINLRFEYSFNQLGEHGLFLHTQSGF